MEISEFFTEFHCDHVCNKADNRNAGDIYFLSLNVANRLLEKRDDGRLAAIEWLRDSLKELRSINKCRSGSKECHCVVCLADHALSSTSGFEKDSPEKVLKDVLRRLEKGYSPDISWDTLKVRAKNFVGEP